MQKIERHYPQRILQKLEINPAVALLGPRQVGKSTLAKEIVSHFADSIYLDLELDSDRAKVQTDPELFFGVNRGKFICLDEVQFLPDIFRTMRGIIDKQGTNTQFLILGSASRDLIRQSAETLAGRIAYIEIRPFSRLEIMSESRLYEYWLRGGYPRSFLALSDEDSFDWRDDYIKSFLERDLPSLGFRIPATTLRRFWTMLAHSHGQVINYSKLAGSLGVSAHTITHYIDILEQTFLVRVLKPYHTNEKKRLVKSPKVYIRDTGLLHALLKIETINDLLGHPVVGHSFEALVIENVLEKFPRHDCFFYRDSSGNEVDLILERGLEKIAVEIKSSTSPRIEKGFRNAVKYLQPESMWLIGQVDAAYPGQKGLRVTNLDLFLTSENS
ncbi:MAG: ATP-binding protein [bacterium]|nr:ATP-binding protein [Gammaproteobacteria bacterium]